MPFRTTEMEKTRAMKKFFKPKESKNPKGSYFQYKGTLFRTETIDYNGNVPLNLEELQKLINNFKVSYADKDEIMGFLSIEDLEKEIRKIRETIENIDDPYERARFEMDLVSNIFRLNTFDKVKVSFASDIYMFWCQHCSEIFFERDIIIDIEFNYPKCSKCKNILQQTPIWILKNKTGKSPVTPLTVWTSGYDLRSLWRRWFDRDYIECSKCGGLLKEYVSLDPARIFGSSRIVCKNCRNINSFYSKNYSLVAPTDNITTPIVAATFSGSTVYQSSVDLKDKLIDSAVFDTDYIGKFLFSPRIRVKEVILAFWHGLNIRRILEAEKTGIELVTSGIFIKLREEYFSKALEFSNTIYEENPEMKRRLEKETLTDSQVKRYVLHSLAHSLLGKFPIYSGLGIDNFGYLYDLYENSVLIYEKCQGGLGASYILTQMQEEKGEPIVLDFLAQIRETIESCDCDDRCKYCLATIGCQEFNHNLNRFSLGPLFKLNTDDLSWGF